jgi:hypothetical protein
LDKNLFHIPKSHGSYVDARTGRRTVRGAKAKERVVTSKEKHISDDDAVEGKVTKVRKCPPRCIVCCAINDPTRKDSKITQTTIYCSVCLVSLCTKMIGSRKTTCFERFHQVQDLSDLQANREQTATKAAASRKRKNADSEDK